MGKRRRARESILKMLYEVDLAKLDPVEVKAHFWKHLDAGHLEEDDSAENQDFADYSFDGVLRNLHEIDRLIEIHSTNWKVSRMNVVDRNILRMAVYELLYCKEIPTNVTLNEAIEIGKKFGTEESGSFINGILDDIAKAIKKGI